MNREIEWRHQAASRAEHLAEMRQTDPPQAQATLAKWEVETAARLHLAEYRNPAKH